MPIIKVKCPAKINLTLKVLNHRSDGFHNIESIMQAIDLYDYLTVSTELASDTQIVLSGNSTEIPYDESNLVYKAICEFLKAADKRAIVKVYIDKNIPVSAGLAGGSTDGAGVILALNELLENPFTSEQLHEICSSLGSDLNFCLEGGCKKATSRGEVLEDAGYTERKVSLIKPVNLGISAKEAYTKFTDKLQTTNRENFVNDLEWAVIDDYSELQAIKKRYPNAIMSGSGSTYFAFDTKFQADENFWIKNDILTIPTGCSIVENIF